MDTHGTVLLVTWIVCGFGLAAFCAVLWFMDFTQRTKERVAHELLLEAQARSLSRAETGLVLPSVPRVSFPWQASRFTGYARG